MIEKISEHIESLMAREKSVKKQFELSPEEFKDELAYDSDPLMEGHHEVRPGLINKYGNRVLTLLTTECAAYCRFCTRRRLVSASPSEQINEDTVDLWVDYLYEHPEVREAIISGGDPFIVNDNLFDYALSKISALDSIKVLRIGTRAPISDPALVNCAKLESIRKVNIPVYIGLHFEHPSELTGDTLKCIKDLQRTGAILYSQSVFLKDVNDNYDTLFQMFTELFEAGVRPYYIYRCDPLPGCDHFKVDVNVERNIMTKLRKNLSGLACPTYVIDAPFGSGKIPVPLDFWDTDTSKYTDFDDTLHQID